MRKLMLIIGGLILIGLVGTFFSSKNTQEQKYNQVSKQENNNDDEFKAYIMLQERVEESLKSPKSARFPSRNEISIKKISDDVYKIDGYVDATNSFNANIRTYYSGKMKNLGNGMWGLVELNFAK